MLYSPAAKRFPMLSHNSSPTVPSQPAINNPQKPAEFPRACPTAFLPLLGHHTPLCLSWRSKYNTHSETEKALAGHARLAPAQRSEILREKEHRESHVRGAKLSAASGKAAEKPKTQSTEGDVETTGSCVRFPPREEWAWVSVSRVGQAGSPTRWG